MRSRFAGELIAEYLGTMIILLFGCGVCAMTNLFGTNVPGEVVLGGFTNVTFGWALGVTFGVFAAARISGAHLNPAVTLALAAFRGFSWRKVVPYCFAQTLGAFCGVAIVFFNYREAFHRFDPSLEKTAGLFTTFPAYPDILSAGFFDQVIGTAILLFLIFALSDARNVEVPSWFSPIAVGMIVLGIGMSFGKLHGYAINPARDFGPRLFTVLAGFRNNGLTDGSGVWWIPIAGPLAGGLLGGGLYDLLIGRFLTRAE
jgi:glycerol uptake facilitator protein